jgi:hypothetical protein
MQPDLFWAIIFAGCLITVAVIVIPNDVGVLKNHNDESALQRENPQIARDPRSRHR